MKTFWFIILIIISIILILPALIEIRDGVELQRPKDLLVGIILIFIPVVLLIALI